MFVICLVISVAVCLLLLLCPLLEPGLAPGSDVPLHVGNVVEAAYLLQSELPPWNWLPDIAGGYGGPNYIYYGAMGFVLPAALVNIGISPLIAIKVQLALAFLIGVVGAYLWCSLFGGRLGGIVGASCYVWSPLYLGLAYSLGSYPFFIACSLYPLVFYLLHRAAISQSVMLAIGSAFVLAVSVCTHTLSVIIIIPFIVLYSVLLCCIYHKLQPMVSVSIVVALCGTIASPYLVGPLVERSQIVLSEQFDSVKDYAAQGIPWYALINSSPAGDDLLARAALPGRLNIIGVVLSLFVANTMLDKTKYRCTLVLISLACIAVVLTTQQGACVSGMVAPQLKYLQFPWRFLGIFNVFASAAASTCFMHHEQSYCARVVVIWIPILCGLYYSPLIASQDLTECNTITRRGIRQSLTTLDHENKYMPAHALLPKTAIPDELLAIETSGTVSIKKAWPNDYRCVVVCNRATKAVFQQYWFSGWRIDVNGERVPCQPTRDLGLCIFELPAGENNVHIYFVDSTIRRVANIISTVSIGAMVVYCIVVFTKVAVAFIRSVPQGES